MTLDIKLSAESTKSLRDRAVALGPEAADDVARMVEEDLRRSAGDKLDWNHVIAAASETSFAFLESEPDLDPHGEFVVD